MTTVPAAPGASAPRRIAVSGAIAGLSGATTTVTLVDLSDGTQVGRASVTDDPATGGAHFHLVAPRPGSYLLVGRAPGAQPVAERVDVGDRPVRRDLVLRPTVTV